MHHKLDRCTKQINIRRPGQTMNGIPLQCAAHKTSCSLAILCTVRHSMHTRGSNRSSCHRRNSCTSGECLGVYKSLVRSLKFS